jgi:hypothetical protein
MAKSIALAADASRRSRFYTSFLSCRLAARRRPSVAPSGTSGAASALITRGGTCEIHREYGSTGGTRVFLLFETSGAVRKLRRREASPLASKPPNSRLAYRPSSQPPCEISGMRHVGPGSAWPENVSSRWWANSVTWKRHGSFCDSSCSLAAHEEVMNLESRRAPRPRSSTDLAIRGPERSNP